MFNLFIKKILAIFRTSLYNVIFKIIKGLFFQAHFITAVPDITPLSLTLVDLNLSFNNFRVRFPLYSRYR